MFSFIFSDILRIYFPIKGEPLPLEAIHELERQKLAEKNYWENIKGSDLLTDDAETQPDQKKMKVV